MGSRSSHLDVNFKEELETFDKLKDHLLASGEGKFALIQGADLYGTWDTYEDALATGYSKFGISKPFLVKQITGLDCIHFFSRELSECRS